MEVAGIGFFLEIGVVGIGGLLWSTLLLSAGTGYEWIPHGLLDSSGLLLFALALAFALGVIIDAIADALVERQVRDIRRRELSISEAEPLAALRRSAFSSQFDGQAIEYVRRKYRIARGWIINSLALAVALNLFTWAQLPTSLPREAISVAGTLCTLLLAAGSAFAARSLVCTECKILKALERSADGPMNRGGVRKKSYE